MFRRMLIYAALTAAGCGAVSAQSARQVFQDNGLIGSFARDCSKPASPDNAYTVYALEPRGVRRVYDLGFQQTGNAHIIRARLMGDNQVVYEQELVDARRTHMTVVLWQFRCYVASVLMPSAGRPAESEQPRPFSTTARG
jgi:hypothetical protein